MKIVKDVIIRIIVQMIVNCMIMEIPAYIGGWDKYQGYARGVNVDKCDGNGWCAIYFSDFGACYLGRNC